MTSSGMLRHVALIITDVSEERIAPTIRVTRMSELVTEARCVAPSSPKLVILMMEETHLSETSVPTRVTERNIPEDGILHSHGREDLKSYNNVPIMYVAIFFVTAACSPYVN
jgi:hypothetical protein